MNRPRLINLRVTFGRALRDGWLIIGITLALFAALEVGVHGHDWVRTKLAGSAPDSLRKRLHPYFGQVWFREFQVESLRRTDHFDPYRGYWSDSLVGRWKNVDARGRRVTVQPPFDSATSRRVFLLGGSTMFGFNAPDSLTIPSLTAASLAARGLRNIEVVNLGQGAFNITQEAITLQLELARGHPPAAVVFFDGQNDIQALYAFGEPGHAFIEPRTQSLINLGRRGFGAELVGLSRHSLLIQRLLAATGVRTRTGTGRHDDVALCRPLADYYRAWARSAQLQARDRGFTVLFVQQPMVATTNKQLSEYERLIRPQPGLFRTCAAALDSVMQADADRDYVSFATMFDGDTATMYTDEFAHLTFRAHRAIADRIAGLIAPALAEPAAGPRR